MLMNSIPLSLTIARGRPALGADGIQFPDHPDARGRDVRHHRQALAREVVHDGQHPEPAAVGQGSAHEVERPTLVRHLPHVGGALVPEPPLRPPRLRTWSRFSRLGHLSFLWFTLTFLLRSSQQPTISELSPDGGELTQPGGGRNRRASRCDNAPRSNPPQSPDAPAPAHLQLLAEIGQSLRLHDGRSHFLS